MVSGSEFLFKEVGMGGLNTLYGFLEMCVYDRVSLQIGKVGSKNVTHDSVFAFAQAWTQTHKAGNRLRHATYFYVFCYENDIFFFGGGVVVFI
jgi:hypothetical protein